jgi:flavin-dependent dehydrogenase
MAYGARSYVGFARLEDGRLNIAAALEVGFLKQMQSPAKAIAQMVEQTRWPALAELSETAWQGTPPLTRRVSRPAGARVLAIGDAGGYIEPFTGEGIGWALASGVKVAEFAGCALDRWQPGLVDEWIALQERTRAQSGRLCRAVTWVSRHPGLARTLVGCVGRWPRLADPLLNRIAWA